MDRLSEAELAKRKVDLDAYEAEATESATHDGRHAEWRDDWDYWSAVVEGIAQARDYIAALEAALAAARRELDNYRTPM